MEDYLEDAFMLQKRSGYTRCTDVAEHFGVKKLRQAKQERCVDLKHSCFSS